jgi:site-specific DNA recombinase
MLRETVARGRLQTERTDCEAPARAENRAGRARPRSWEPTMTTTSPSTHPPTSAPSASASPTSPQRRSYLRTVAASSQPSPDSSTSGPRLVDPAALRAVVYARVSSKAQEERCTIESQLRAVPEFIERRGWTLARPADAYVDDGRTAKAGHLEQREAFTRLLKDAAAGAFDVVCVFDLDRLTRSEDLMERGIILGSLQRAGVQIADACKGQLLDLATSGGDLQASLGSYFAAEDNRKRRERTVQGKLTAISRGRKPSGPTPYGYSYDRAAGLWSIRDDQAEVVRELYARVVAGETAAFSLSEELNARGVPRPRGGAWQRDRVWAILVNPLYKGTYVADKRRGLTMKVPAVVSEEEWAAAQEALEHRRSYPLPRTHYVSLLAGLGTCALCGSPINISGNSKGRRYYACRDKLKSGKNVARCPNTMREVTNTDHEVWAVLRGMLERDDLLEEAVGLPRAPSCEDRHDWEADLRKADERLAKLEKAQATMLDALRRGLIGPDAVEEQLPRYAHDRKVIQQTRELAIARRDAALHAKVDRAAVKRTVAALRDRLAEASPEAKRDLVRLLVPPGGASFSPDGVELRGMISFAKAGVS